jgi:ATP-dependent Clp protease ATP-binding subunit ClpA
MYERFTDRARKVMQYANQEAQRFNHEYIGTEHILLGLVKEGSGVAANVLKNLNIDLRKVRLQVEKIVQAGPDAVTMGKLPQTPRAKKVIEYAIEEAGLLHHNYVGTEHLLLGLIREQEGVAAHVLMNLGVKLEDVHAEIFLLLGPTSEDYGPRFSQRARKVMELAAAETRRFNYDYIGTEHVLLGLIQEAALSSLGEPKPGVAARAFKQLGVDLHRIATAIENALLVGPAPVIEIELPYAARLERAIRAANAEARSLRLREVGTGLLLIGLLADDESLVAKLLRQQGVSIDDLRAATRALLPQAQPAPIAAPQASTPVDPYATLADLPADAIVEVELMDSEIARLNEEKEDAIADQDFERAAHLRDEADKVRKRKLNLIRRHREPE